jgi:hypothetical protein
MKTIFRVLVILVVAAIVGGTIFAAVNHVSAGAGPQRAFEEGNRPFRPDGDRERTQGGFGLPFGVVKSLVIISIIAAIYFNVIRFFGKKKTVPASVS